MKLNTFRLLPYLAVLLPSYGAAVTTISATDFVAKCAAAAQAKKGIPGLNLEATITVNHDEIQVFRLESGIRSSIDIAAMIERGPVGDPVEIPRITVVCLNDQPLPTQNFGDIEFPSGKGDTVTLRFHLMGLKYTTWKKDPNDTVWMVDFSPNKLKKHPHPHENDWAKCIKKNVQFIGNGDITFPLCSNPKKKVDLYYEYALRMDQTGSDGVPVDVVIDPQIINHPK